MERGDVFPEIHSLEQQRHRLFRTLLFEEHQSGCSATRHPSHSARWRDGMPRSHHPSCPGHGARPISRCTSFDVGSMSTRPHQRIERVVEPLLLDQHATQVREALEMLGIDAEGGLEAHLGLRKIACLPRRHSEHVVAPGVVRLLRRVLLEDRRRVGVALLALYAASPSRETGPAALGFVSTGVLPRRQSA